MIARPLPSPFEDNNEVDTLCSEVVDLMARRKTDEDACASKGGREVSGTESCIHQFVQMKCSSKVMNHMPLKFKCCNLAALVVVSAV